MLLPVILTLFAARSVFACDSCYGQPSTDVVLTRNVRRMQPDAEGAVTAPKSALEWGQINFLHTTDTHGWLEGHLKERNYGADWGDFVSFTKHMRDKAAALGVDLLLVDTGDLHDGAGLSDATSPNGLVSNQVFEAVDYDLLTIGNHELYVTEVAYETFNNFSKVYGDRYLTSNVQIINPTTNQFEYIGHQYRYFSTAHGLRVMSFGVLFDFTGNSNVSKVINAATMVNQTWFLNAVNFTEPIDMFIVLGHNPVRPTVSTSTLGIVVNAIRKLRPDTPIQVFGGHTHIRDFVVYDDKATGLESGRYCETLGWLAMSGVNSTNHRGAVLPSGVTNPNMPAVKIVVNATTTSSATKTTSSTATSTIWQWPKYNPSGIHGTLGSFGSPDQYGNDKPLPSLVYARRYLDWNRLTFEYHANGSQVQQYGRAAPSQITTPFNTAFGLSETNQITADRQVLNLTAPYGCAPQSWCQSCAPFGSPANLFTLLGQALATTVVNSTRSSTPRLIIINTGSVRFDLPQGPFTYDDSFIVSPFADAFQYLPTVPYSAASQVLSILNAGPYQKKRDLSTVNFGFEPLTLLDADSCIDPPVTRDLLRARSTGAAKAGGRLIRRQSTALTPGYTTTDDFGAGGDDTPHSRIPYFAQPNDLQANASFPLDGSTPATVDLIFLDFIAPYVLNALAQVGMNYSSSQVSYYLPKSFTTNSYLPAYAKVAWQANLLNCPVGTGVVQQ